MKKSVIFVVLLLIILPIAISKEVSHVVSGDKIEVTPEKVRTSDSEHYIYGVAGKEAVMKGDEVTYIHSDHLGSHSLVTNLGGDLVEENKYLPFGEALQESEERFTFTGKELDEKSKLQYTGARYYDKDIGRFTTIDPIKDGMNHYVYAGNNPLKYVDPTGTEYVNPYFIGPLAEDQEYHMHPEVVVTPDISEDKPRYIRSVGDWLNDEGVLEEQFTPSLVQTAETLAEATAWVAVAGVGGMAVAAYAGPVAGAYNDFCIRQAVKIQMSPGRIGAILRFGLGLEYIGGTSSTTSSTAATYSTQTIGNTGIPKSAEVTVPSGQRVYVTPNAIDHAQDVYNTALKQVGSNVPVDHVGAKIAAQTHFRHLIDVLQNTHIPFDQLVTRGGFEIYITSQSTGGPLPAVIHALPVAW